MYAQQHNDKSVEIEGSRDLGNRTEFNFSNDVLAFPSGEMHDTTRTLVLVSFICFSNFYVRKISPLFTLLSLLNTPSPITLPQLRPLHTILHDSTLRSGVT